LRNQLFLKEKSEDLLGEHVCEKAIRKRRDMR
jgi:hypothetical protein